jgi:hypothetical protein
MNYQFSDIIMGFTIRLDTSGGTPTVVCQGTLDLQDSAGLLQPDLLRFHDAARVARVLDVRLDMTGMDYMNSSGIKAFMTWFLRNEKDGGYALEVLYDPQRTWQSVSFKTMARLAAKTLRITAAGEVPK